MIDTTAIVDADQIGEGTRIWGLAHIREEAQIGSNCTIGRGAYIDRGVRIGNGCKIQNGAMIYAPAMLGDGVFVGPGALITNDRLPRAVDENFNVKGGEDWTASGVRIQDGASVGANATVIGGVTLGAWSMLAAGAVAHRDIPAHALAVGVPARIVGWIGRTGARLRRSGDDQWVDPVTTRTYREIAGELQEVPS